MFTSEELGVEPLAVGDYVYMFDWSKPLHDQLCTGKVTEVLSLGELREAYRIKSEMNMGKFQNRLYHRMEIEKAPNEPNWVVKKHLDDLKDFIRKNAY